MRRVVTWQLSGDQPKDLRLAWGIGAAARAALEEEIFGKHVLITDHDDWPVAEVIAGYRSQSEAEFSFRQIKDPHVVSFSPMHHWTEHNIRVHTFTCVLALQIAHLMRLKARRAGLDLSVRELLGELAGIGETVLLYQGERGRPRAHRMLTETSPVQDKLASIFGLARYAPRRMTWVIHQTQPGTAADQQKQTQDQLIRQTRASRRRPCWRGPRTPRDWTQSRPIVLISDVRPESGSTGQKNLTFIEAARRAQIVAAAIDTIAELGYGRASLARIAKRAGTSKGVISYHFASKDDLIREIVAEVLARAEASMLPRILAQSSSGSGHAAGLHRVEPRVHAGAPQSPGRRSSRSSLTPAARTAARSFDEKSLDYLVTSLEQLLAHFQAAGDFRADFDPQVMALAIRGAIDQMPPRLARDPDLDVDGYAREMAALFDRATRGEPER